ncbi:MAG: PAS-domain containing protein, partial [Alphaproteobacteria bacterium]|nr:PAS-domain containing protein [Alphaproteobacteria bacterium]
MTDIVLESVRVVIVLCLVLYLWHAGREKLPPGRKGWRLILGGFSLLLLGSIFDVTDNFESLNRFVIIGDTEAEAFLEKVVGYLGGFVLLAVGLVRWVPSVRQLSIEVAARKKAEQEIAEKSAVLETTFESMSQGFAAYDADLRLTAFNQRYLELRDYPPGFIHLGMPFEKIARYRAERGDYGPGDVEELVKGAMERARLRTVERSERTLPDGLVTSVVHDPLPGGGYVVSITDITEHKRAEQEIAEKSALLETTLEKMSHGITVYDRNLDLLAFNQRYVDLWDYPAGFIRLGMPFEEVARFGAQRGDYGPGDVDELVRQRVETRKRGEVYQYQRVMPNGTIMAINREAMPGGGTVTTYTDITERKQAEQEIAEKSAVLERTFESMSQGITVYDASHRLIAFNQRYLDIRGYPEGFFHLGQSYEKIVRFNAERGEYGPGEIEKQIRDRVNIAAKFEPHKFERVRP